MERRVEEGRGESGRHGGWIDGQWSGDVGERWRSGHALRSSPVPADPGTAYVSDFCLISENAYLFNLNQCMWAFFGKFGGLEKAKTSHFNSSLVSSGMSFEEDKEERQGIC